MELPPGPPVAPPISVVPHARHGIRSRRLPPGVSLVSARYSQRIRRCPARPESMKHTLFLDFIGKLPCHPKHDLVFVIDTFDECGDDRSRSLLLEVLVNVAKHASWLKIIITSGPKVDIQ